MAADQNSEVEREDKPDPSKGFVIRIDRNEYTVHEEKLSGEQLRQLPDPPVPPDRDLYQVIAGHEDRKIKNDDTVPMHDGLRFFTAPNTINPGASTPADEAQRVRS